MPHNSRCFGLGAIYAAALAPFLFPPFNSAEIATTRNEGTDFICRQLTESRQCYAGLSRPIPPPPPSFPPTTLHCNSVHRRHAARTVRRPQRITLRITSPGRIAYCTPTTHVLNRLGATHRTGLSHSLSLTYASWAYPTGACGAHLGLLLLRPLFPQHTCFLCH